MKEPSEIRSTDDAEVWGTAIYLLLHSIFCIYWPGLICRLISRYVSYDTVFCVRTRLYCHRKFDQTNIRWLWSCWLEGSTTCPTSLRDILGYTTIVNNKVCVFEFVEPRWHRNSDPWGPALAADNAEVKNLRAFLTFHTRKRFLLGIEPTNTMARSGRSTNCNRGYSFILWPNKKHIPGTYIIYIYIFFFEIAKSCILRNNSDLRGSPLATVQLK